MSLHSLSLEDDRKLLVPLEGLLYRWLTLMQYSKKKDAVTCWRDPLSLAECDTLRPGTMCMAGLPFYARGATMTWFYKASPPSAEMDKEEWQTLPHESWGGSCCMQSGTQLLLSLVQYIMPLIRQAAL